MRILLAPHNDDETLFASYICQQFHPLVIVCLRSYVQASRGGPDYRVREAETLAATKVLGCDYEQWGAGDDKPHWSSLERRIYELDRDDLEEVIVPAYDFERNGWPDDGSQTGYGLYHHDMIGKIAHKLFGDRCVFYQTYARWDGKVEEGVQVIPTAEQITGKLAALSCYQSQIVEASTQMHFTGPMREWVRA